jgi:hypothetical protein
MKIIFVFLLIAAVCPAQEIINKAEADITWDAVTTLADGNPIPVGDTVEYDVLISADTDLTTYVITGRVSTESFHIIVPLGNTYYVGVRAIWVTVLGDRFPGDVAWSHIIGVNAALELAPWILYHPSGAAEITNLKQE